MADLDPEFLRFSKAIMRRAYNVEKNTDRLVQKAFLKVAHAVIIHTPVWSGQATLNWTAAVSTTLPQKRFVNVPRSNVKARQGKRVDIVVDAAVAASANTVAFFAARQIAWTYKHPKSPSMAVPRPTDVFQKASFTKPPAIYLSNSINYAPKLWSGTWPNNPRTLRGELGSANSVLSSARLLDKVF